MLILAFVLTAIVSLSAGWGLAVLRGRYIRVAIKSLWDENLAETIDRLTSDEVLAETLARMDEEQLRELADLTYDRKQHNGK